MGPSLMDTLWFEFWKTKILIALLFKTGWEDSPPLLCSWIKWWWSRELASLINIGFKNENLAASSRHLLYFPGGLIIIDHNQLCGGMDGTHCGIITKWILISPKPSYLSQQQWSKFGYVWFDLSWCGTHDTQRDFADHKISVIFRRLNLAPNFSKQQLTLHNILLQTHLK